MRASVVKSVSSGRGFVNDAMVVQWDPFGEIVQTEVDGWNVTWNVQISIHRELDIFVEDFAKNTNVWAQEEHPKEKMKKKQKHKQRKHPKVVDEKGELSTRRRRRKKNNDAHHQLRHRDF